MQAVCDVLEQLVRENTLRHYAIGGATAAGFHGEPLATRDVDVFVFIDPPVGALLGTLEPLFNRLRASTSLPSHSLSDVQKIGRGSCISLNCPISIDHSSLKFYLVMASGNAGMNGPPHWALKIKSDFHFLQQLSS